MKPQPIRVVLLMSNKLRDLAGLAYFKVLLEARLGLSVRIVNALNWRYALAHRPHIVMVPSIWNPVGLGNLIEIFKTRGILVGFLPTEGVLRCDDEVSLIYGNDLAAVRQVDVTFVWGEALRSILRRFYGLDPRTLELCGALRFDLYRPPLSKLYFSSRESFCQRLGLNPDWPIVTWATGYPGAERFRERMSQGLDEANFKGLQIPGFTGLQFARMQLAAQDAAFAGVRELIRSLPNVSFIIKVRPDETTRLYDELRRTTDPSRVMVVKSEPIFTLAQASDVWLHWNSTTSSEAWFFDRPSVNLLLGAAGEYCLEELGQGSVAARTADDLYDTVKRFLKDPAIPADLHRARHDFIAKWFHRIDGQAGARHVEAVERLLARAGVLNDPPLDWPTVRVRALGAMKQLLGREEYESVRLWGRLTGDVSALASRVEVEAQERLILDALES